MASELTDILKEHCGEAARIVKDFCENTGFEIPKRTVTLTVTMQTYNEDIETYIDSGDIINMFAEEIENYVSISTENFTITNVDIKDE